MRNKLIIFFLILFILGIIAIKVNFPAYREIGKAFISSDLFSLKPADDPTDTLWGSLTYNIKIFSLYGLIGFLSLGLAGIIWTAFRKKWQALVPFLVVSPTFLYLAHSYISSDHPWMLRRFAFSLIPAFILYSVIFLYNYHGRNSARQKIPSLARNIFLALIIASLFISNLFIFFRFIIQPGSTDSLSQIGTISQKFTSRDLILVDRLATGHGWSMMTGPLDLIFGKQAVYFFNPKDLAKIDRNRYENIYLISSKENVEWWLDSLSSYDYEIIDSYVFHSRQLEITSNPDNFPALAEQKIEGKIILIK